MGNGPSSRRNGRIQHNPVSHSPPARMVPPPPGYPGSHPPLPGPPPYPMNGHHLPHFYPTNHNGHMTAAMAPQFYPQGYIPSNGQHMMNPGFRSGLPNASPQPPVAESQKANTIRNDVNLNKSTLRLERDEENPGFHLVAFSFDANVAGSISIFFLVKEKEDCGFAQVKPHLYEVKRVSFEKGFGQKFRQEPGSGVNLSMFDERDLTKGEDGDGIYSLVVRTETLAETNLPENVSLQERPIGAPLPRWIHCQTTQGVIERKDDGNLKVRVVKQTIWIDGTKYELQEIYGIENSGGGGGFDGNDSGKECVICMSEPRDTTVLPCRHMCMCSECAKVLKFQTNRCPICRTPVERLLEINLDKAPKTNNGAGASQSSAWP